MSLPKPTARRFRHGRAVSIVEISIVRQRGIALGFLLQKGKIEMHKYNYRKSTFAAAKFCVEIGADQKKRREIAEAISVNKSDLEHACAILKTNSSLLHELVELGIWSFAEAKEQIRRLLGNRRKRLPEWAGVVEDFERRIRWELNATLPGEFISRLSDFLIAHGDKGNRNIIEFLRNIKKKLEGSSFAAVVAGTALPPSYIDEDDLDDDYDDDYDDD